MQVDIIYPGSIPGLGRSPGGGQSNPLQYTCLENPMDRGAWKATVHRMGKSRTRQSDLACTHTHTHTLEHYSAMKKKEVTPFVASQMDLEIIILSEVSQTERDKYMIMLICGI